MRFVLFAVLGLVTASPAFGAGTSDPCAAFPWRLDKEKILLSQAAGTTAYAGSYLDRDPPVGFRLLLTPNGDVAYAHPLEGAGGAKGFGGVLKLGTPPAAGDYLITMSGDGAVNVIQGRGAAPLVDEAVVKDCPSIHQSVKFLLNMHDPLTLQISGSSKNSVNVAVTPAEYFDSRPPGTR